MDQSNYNQLTIQNTYSPMTVLEPRLSILATYKVNTQRLNGFQHFCHPPRVQNVLMELVLILTEMDAIGMTLTQAHVDTTTPPPSVLTSNAVLAMTDFLNPC